MTKIALHYNPNCSACVRQAKRTAQMDWLRRVALTTEDSPLGQIPAGKIVIVDKRSNEVLTGIYATRKVCMQIPLYFLYGLLLHLLPIRVIAGIGKRGCDADACEV